MQGELLVGIAGMCLFALALSMDALSIGIAYGIRKIRIPVASLFIISLVSAVAIYISMMAGSILASTVSLTAARCIGGLILTGVGVWILAQGLSGRSADNPEVVRVRIRSLGLVIQVLREPSTADLDRSGAINPGEALLLGSALAIDAIGAGFAVSMLAFEPIPTAVIVGAGQVVLACIGLIVGKTFSATTLGQKAGLVPGLILIALGLVKMRE